MKKSVLIADDDKDIVRLLTLRCEKLGFEVNTAENAMQALSRIEATMPDVVILDVDMPDGNGLSVREMMSNHERLDSIPAIMLTCSTSEETVRRCHEQCSYYVLKCPDVWSRVEPVLVDLFNLHPEDEMEDSELPTEPSLDISDGACELMDAVFAMLGADQTSETTVASEPREESQTPWVLSIEDDDDFAMALRLRLQEYGLRVIRAAAGTEGYRRAFLEAPRAIILDYELPRGNGDYVLRRLKESPATSEIPVIVLTGRREANIERQMRGLGASEFLNKPLDWRQLQNALELNADLQGRTGRRASMLSGRT